MSTTEKTVEVLNDLIRINNDRIAGYEKAEAETDIHDADLKAIFRQMAAESRSYVNDLTKYIAVGGTEPASGTTISGKIYRAWMDVKITFTGQDRKSILASCEFGEDAAQKAYEDVLMSDAEISAELRQLIIDQKNSLTKSHNTIKSLRDVQPA